jgi:hypothetical protein
MLHAKVTPPRAEHVATAGTTLSHHRSASATMGGYPDHSGTAMALLMWLESLTEWN